MRDLLRADGESSCEVDRDALKEGVREQLAERDADGGGERAEHAGLEGQQHEDLTPVISLQAQVGDEAPALGHRQQHRVDRQQKADHHADRGEQRGRLVVGADRLIEQPQLVLGRDDVEALARDAQKLAAHARPARRDAARPRPA